jgi:hypothetical protein
LVHVRLPHRNGTGRDQTLDHRRGGLRLEGESRTARARGHACQVDVVLDGEGDSKKWKLLKMHTIQSTCVPDDRFLVQHRDPYIRVPPGRRTAQALQGHLLRRRTALAINLAQVGDGKGGFLQHRTIQNFEISAPFTSAGHEHQEGLTRLCPTSLAA